MWRHQWKRRRRSLHHTVHLPWKFLYGDCSYVVWMRTFLLFLPFLWLRNELFAGTLLPLFCNRDNDDVDDEKDECGVVGFRRRGNENEPGASFTFSFTLNILMRVSRFTFLCLARLLFFQCQQVSRLVLCWYCFENEKKFDLRDTSECHLCSLVTLDDFQNSSLLVDDKNFDSFLPFSTCSLRNANHEAMTSSSRNVNTAFW